MAGKRARLYGGKRKGRGFGDFLASGLTGLGTGLGKGVSNLLGGLFGGGRKKKRKGGRIVKF